MVRIPKIRREALLPVVEFREPVDPPDSVVSRFRIHDLLLFIGYLREENVTFEDLKELRKEMPRLYARADELTRIEPYMRRWNYIGGVYVGEAKHRPNLVVTSRRRHNRKYVPYKNNLGPEVVAMVRDLYREGYSLNKLVFDTEIKGLSPALLGSLGKTCDEVDFSYMPSVTKKREFFRRGYSGKRITGDTLAYVFDIPHTLDFSNAIFASGIDAVIAREEEKIHRDRLLRLIINIVDKKGIVPADVVRELRKYFACGSTQNHVNRFSFSIEIRDAIRNFLGETRFDEKYGILRSSLFYDDKWFDKSGLDDIGSRFFGFGKERTLDERCEDAFVKLYQKSRRRFLDEACLDNFALYFAYLHNVLIARYGNMDKALIAFYGLEKVRFKRLDKDIAHVNARHVAEELRLKEEDFYRLAKELRLPVIKRQERTYGFLHDKNVDLLLTKVGERFDYYEKILIDKTKAEA